MTEQLAKQEQHSVSYTEIPDATLAERIQSTRNNLEFATGERRRVVMLSLTRLLFEQESRKGLNAYAETSLAVQGYHMLYGAESHAPSMAVSLELEASEGAVASS